MCSAEVAEHIGRKRCMQLLLSLLLAVGCMFTEERKVRLCVRVSPMTTAGKGLTVSVAKSATTGGPTAKLAMHLLGSGCKLTCTTAPSSFIECSFKTSSKHFAHVVDWYIDLQTWSVQRHCKATQSRRMRISCRCSVSIILSMTGVKIMACRDCFAWQGVTCNMSTMSLAAAIRLLYLYVLLQVPKANGFV